MRADAAVDRVQPDEQVRGALLHDVAEEEQRDDHGDHDLHERAGLDERREADEQQLLA